MSAKSERWIEAESSGTFTSVGACCFGGSAGTAVGLLFCANADAVRTKNSSQASNFRDMVLTYEMRRGPVHHQTVGALLNAGNVTKRMIRGCEWNDFDAIWSIINDGAEAYRGVIPPDRLRTPYMSREELRHEIESGVSFWGYSDGDELLGVMGIQDVQIQGVPDVTLIRHAYVRAASQGRGIGAQLLGHLRQLTPRPVLIGTWADADWAIRFYRRHGFETVGREEKDRLLKQYWTIPDRQVETSVVMADARWRERL